MERIATGPLERDREKFLTLLTAARDAADEDGHWKIVSVSLASKAHIDPLAVLESIYEGEARHFYLEHPERDAALAGAEAVVERSYSGPGRFAQARDFARDLFENTIAVGELELPLAGPKLFAAFSFEDEADADAPFAPATLFLPRWQVTSSSGAYVATANLIVEPGGDIEAQAERALAAHAKFSGFSYEKSFPELPHDAGKPLFRPGAGSDAYRAAVAKALEIIDSGALEKVVVARREAFESPGPIHPLRTLAILRERFPSCRSFSFGGPDAAFIGATPELLARVCDGLVESEALAGTTARGRSASEDAALASELMASDKEMREHAAVARAVHAALESLGLSPGPMPRPRIHRLPNAQHIRTPFAAKLREGLHLFDIAAALHPTPATCGLPRAAAVRAIADIEGAPRGLFSGLVGWCDDADGGELAVALRSGLVDGNRAVLYAGAGIVRGSTPGAEDRETLLKLSALGEAIF
ncbi:MAG TPA: isochorismate synthase [Opitutales bacterium]|nr:isochorismate synthase [Opitutales bacterium]